MGVNKSLMQRLLLADSSRPSQHSRLTRGKTLEVSRQAAPDSNQALARGPINCCFAGEPKQAVPI